MVWNVREKSAKFRQVRECQGESGEVREFISEKLKGQGKSGNRFENLLQRVLLSSIFSKNINVNCQN